MNNVDDILPALYLIVIVVPTTAQGNVSLKGNRRKVYAV
jgi:hypothetical protein